MSGASERANEGANGFQYFTLVDFIVILPIVRCPFVFPRLLWEMKADDQFIRRRHVRENNAMASEMAAARKVALNVRRAALKRLVEEDHEKHKKELENMFGKTFYVDRL